MRADIDFQSGLKGARILTAEILYHLPDYPGLLQSFVWQTLDTAPRYPRLARFLDHWRREIEAVIHSIRIGHGGDLAPVQVDHVGGELRLH